MPLTGQETAMATLIVTNLKAQIPMTPKQEAEAIQYWTPICKGIIDTVVAQANVVLGPGIVQVTGSPAAQSNPAPIIQPGAGPAGGIA